MPITRDLFAFRCDSDLGRYAALKAGVGVGFCQHALGKRDGLTPLLGGALRFELGVWVVMHRDLESSRRVRLLFEHVARYLTAYIAAGNGP